MMKRNKHRAIFAFVMIVGGATLSIGNGCSQQYTNRGTSVDQNSAGTSTPASGSSSTDIPVIPGARTVSLVYSKQVLDQLSSCTGLAIPSDKTTAMYEQKQGAISTYGYANTVTSPMMMAVTSIAGEICNDLINQETINGPRLFVGYNFAAAAALPNSAQLADSVSRIALSCWQRNESDQERQLILDMVNSSVAVGEASAGRKSALMICTAMLSSLDSLLN